MKKNDYKIKQYNSKYAQKRHLANPLKNQLLRLIGQDRKCVYKNKNKCKPDK